jgi:hypothetical protein
MERTDLRMEVISARRLPLVGGFSAFQLVIPLRRHERKPDRGRVHFSCAAERVHNDRESTC